MMEMDTLRGTITYPTLGKTENQFQKLRLVGDMLVLKISAHFSNKPMKWMIEMVSKMEI